MPKKLNSFSRVIIPIMKNKKVFVTISGGVDSSVAATLLKEQGYDCTGVYFKLFDTQKAKGIWQKAQGLCKHINIPFKLYDLRKEFKRKVQAYFIQEYKNGRTPNPCVICNEQIKFGLFFDRAMKEGADLIATGHYARIFRTHHPTPYTLLMGKDKSKDQSYFLYRLNQKQLSKTLFPIGEYTKTEVKEFAKKYKLPTAKSKESQDICFLQNKSINEYLKKFIRTNEGNITDAKGNVLGTHDGYFKYTIGQREGLGLSGGPYYVVGIDAKKNTVIVTNSNTSNYLLKSEIRIKSPSWIRGKAPKLPLKCQVSIRLNHSPQKATLNRKENSYIITFKESQRAPTPGQSAVVYKGEECLGGGIIL
jgi:tRNA-specific 2-thiouridylase